MDRIDVGAHIRAADLELNAMSVPRIQNTDGGLSRPWTACTRVKAVSEPVFGLTLIGHADISPCGYGSEGPAELMLTAEPEQASPDVPYRIAVAVDGHRRRHYSLCYPPVAGEPIPEWSDTGRFSDADGFEVQLIGMRRQLQPTA